MPRFFSQAQSMLLSINPIFSPIYLPFRKLVWLLMMGFYLIYFIVKEVKRKRHAIRSNNCCIFILDTCCLMETGLVHSKFLGVQRQVRHYGHLYSRITKLTGLSQAINFNLYKYIWIRNGSCNKPRVLSKIWRRGRITLTRWQTMLIKRHAVVLLGPRGGGGGPPFIGRSRSLSEKIFKLGFWYISE